MTTSPPSNKLPEPEFPVGTVVELKNNVDAIPLEDRLGIVREYFLKNTLTDSPYIAYSVELVTKPGVFRLRTKQFLKAANMPTKQPTPPPKFNIRDQVLYNFSRWKVTNRKYKNCNWLYELEAVEENKQGIHNTEAHEKFITLASPSPYDPMHFPQETKTVVNEQGGKQSHLDARFDCIPPVVLRLLAQCLGFGARKYGKENWKNIPQQDNLNHAMNHINEWNRGNRDEPHLVNAMARLTFALWQAVDSKDQPDTYLHPDNNQ